MIFEDMRAFRAWQDAVCDHCTTDWNTCRIITHVYLAGPPEELSEAPDGTVTCSEYEERNEIEGVPA